MGRGQALCQFRVVRTKTPYEGPNFVANMSNHKGERPLVLVTGSAGQLGSCFRDEQLRFPGLELVFSDRIGLDVTLKSQVSSFMESLRPAAVVNCAAYTNVERAEAEEERAYQLNCLAPQYLAEACDEANALLVHFSTDYVFDGSKGSPYLEDDPTSPLNAYGRTKLEGERLVDNACNRYLIIRTSWLYSRHGHNFYRTMARLAREQSELRVVSDQVASPTSGHQLASDMLSWLRQALVETRHTDYGVYHYTQSGEASWSDFARAIVSGLGLDTRVVEVATADYPTKAVRPAYSKLDTHRFFQATGLADIPWQEALRHCQQGERNT